MFFRTSFIALFLFAVSACGGGDGDTGTGGGSDNSGVAACTESRIYGVWEVTATANGITQTDTINVQPDDSASGKLTLNGNNFTYVEDGVTLNGTINDACNSMSGTFSGNGISGGWSAVKQ